MRFYFQEDDFMSTPKKPTPGKSKISKKPAVEFEISEEDLDKASGGGSEMTTPPPYTTADMFRPTAGGSTAGTCDEPRRR
jgi:hypothetical protein